MKVNTFRRALLATLAAGAMVGSAWGQEVVIDAKAPARPFPHFWEQMFGSGRAILALRDGYRQDLRDVKRATDFKYVRFHAIFHDEVGVYDEDKDGKPVYNFSYVDQIYDGLLDAGVKPFVELSFMPNKLAASQNLHAFRYHPNIAPPKDYAKWDALIKAFAQHLVDRYGIEEVASWYFEVWNEPNLDFWGGEPRQASYFELYDHTALALKAVSPRLRVGGPSTAQAAWVDAFIKHASDKHIPVDFASTHVYANDTSKDVLGTDEAIPRKSMVCRAVAKVHGQIAASAMPHLPLFWTEFNASYMNEPKVTDAAFMGPWLAETISQCDGLVDSMSYWSFSDVFEEQGVVKTPFYGGYGLVAADNLPKPAFNAFKLLHRLGKERLDVKADQVLATRNKDGSLVLAAWNYAAPEVATNAPRKVTFTIKNSKATTAWVSRVDAAHGDLHAVYERMGSPQYPTRAQIRQLRKAADLPPPQKVALAKGKLEVTLPTHALALIELR